MARVFRFKIDLRNLDGAQAREQDRPMEPASDHFALSDGLQERLQEEAVDREFCSRLAGLGPAHSIGEVATDAPLARELLRSYNASLARAQRAELGHYSRRGIDHNVFFDRWDNKHVITRSQATPDERVSELVAAPDGRLLRLAFEWVEGPLEPLEDLFRNGLSQLEDDTPRLSQCPGYSLRTTAFERRADHLEAVVQRVFRFDPVGGRVVDSHPEHL